MNTNIKITELKMVNLLQNDLKLISIAITRIKCSNEYSLNMLKSTFIFAYIFKVYLLQEIRFIKNITA